MTCTQPPKPAVFVSWSNVDLRCKKLTLRTADAAAGSLELVSPDRHWLQITDLYVEPLQRSKGWGRLLLGLAMSRALAARKSHLRLVADDDGSGALRAWYLACGFYPLGVDARGRPILEAALNRELLLLLDFYQLQGNPNG